MLPLVNSCFSLTSEKYKTYLKDSYDDKKKNSYLFSEVGLNIF